MQPSFHGTLFFTYPNEEVEFSIPASVGVDKPAVYLNGVFAEVIDSTRTLTKGEPGDVWTRYTIGPGKRGETYLAYGKHVDHVPRFAFSVLLECPNQTVEIPCVVWFEGRSCRFALAADVPSA
jgi:hypothetical protein